MTAPVEDEGFDLSIQGNSVCIDLNYPNIDPDKKVTRVRLGLNGRAAEDITIEFCHNRNCWLISRRIELGLAEGAPEGTFCTHEVASEVFELALIPAETRNSPGDVYDDYTILRKANGRLRNE